MIDLWTLLRIQLHVTLAFPSSGDVDPLASPSVAIADPEANSQWDEAAQAKLIDEYVGLLVSKPNVTGVFWTHFGDQAPHFFPNSGVLRPDGSPKPALAALQAKQQNRIRPGTDSMDSDGSWSES